MGGRGAFRLGVILFYIGLLAVGTVGAQVVGGEVVITEADFKALDTFEATLLAKADRLYASREFRTAVAEYDLFVVENPRSTAVAYALLRKGRSQMGDNKRGEAIRTFREVVDYFPDAVLYAGAALYYQGVCYFENGLRKQAVIAWKKMVTDPEYLKHVLAGPALVGIANELYREEKYTEALKIYDQAAVDFRDKHPESARQAIDRASYILIRLATNIKKMLDFYTRARTTRHHPEAADETKFWRDMPALIDRFGNFAAEEVDQRADYYKTWASAMETHFTDDNEYRFVWAEFRFREEGDIAKWNERIDKQFVTTFKPGDYPQIFRFMEEFGKKGQKGKIEEYYLKLNFARMDNDMIFRLMKIVAGSLGDIPMAKNAYTNIKHEKWDDGARNGFVGWAAGIDEGMVVHACQNMKNPDFGRYRLLQYYHQQSRYCTTASDPIKKGLEVAEDVVKMPNYADEAYWMKAEIHECEQKWAEANEAYKITNREPENLFRIAENLLRLDQKGQALGQLSEIENFFEGVAPRAALRIAYVHRGANDEPNFIAALHAVMDKYPHSGESNTAHIELERLGVAMRGAEDAK